MKRRDGGMEREDQTSHTLSTEECHHIPLQEASSQLLEVCEHHHHASIKPHTLSPSKDERECIKVSAHEGGCLYFIVA